MATGALALMTPAIAEPIHGFAETTETTDTPTDTPQMNESTSPTSPTDGTSESEPTPDTASTEEPAVEQEAPVDVLAEAMSNYESFDVNILPSIKYQLSDVLNKDVIEESDFTNENLSKITYLYDSYSDVASLSGFDKLVNLEKLYLSNTKIKDFSILKGLNKLQVLDISKNGLIDFNVADFPNVQVDNSYNFSSKQEPDTIWIPESKTFDYSDWMGRKKMRIYLTDLFPMLNNQNDGYTFKNILKNLNWTFTFENNQNIDVEVDSENLVAFLSFKDDTNLPEQPVSFTVSNDVFSTEGVLGIENYPTASSNPEVDGEENYSLFDEKAIPSIEEQLKVITGKEQVEKSDFNSKQLSMITDLDVSEKGIKHLNGFGKLTALKNLNISDNEISSYAPILGLELDNLNISDNPVILSRNLFENIKSVEHKGNLAVSIDGDARGEDFFFLGTKQHHFKSDEDEYTFSVADLIYYSEFDNPISKEEFERQAQKIELDVQLSKEAQEYYALSYDKETKTGVIKDLGKQPAKDFEIKVVYNGKEYSVGTLTPKKLKNTDLKDPLKKMWHNAYGWGIYEKESGKVFVAPDYNGNDSKMLYSEKIKGIQSIDIKENYALILDKNGDLFLVDDSTNSGLFNIETDVIKISSNVSSFSSDQYYTFILKNDGSLVRKKLSTHITPNAENNQGEETSLSNMKFTAPFVENETFLRYGKYQMILEGEDGNLYFASSKTEFKSNNETDEDGNIVPNADDIFQLPFQKEQIENIFYNGDGETFAYTTTVSLKNGKTYEVMKNPNGEGFLIQELSVSHIVDAKNQYLLTKDGRILVRQYVYSDDAKDGEKEGDYRIVDTKISNVKKIVAGYSSRYANLFYLTNDGDVVFIYDDFDERFETPLSPGEPEILPITVDSGIEDIFYKDGSSVITKKNGVYQVSTIQWDYWEYWKEYVTGVKTEPYNFSYLGGLSEAPIGTPTEPTDPKPPIVNPEPETPVVTPEPETPPVIPPIATPEPETPVVTPEPENPVVIPPVVDSETPTEPTEPTPPVVPEEEKPPVVTPEPETPVVIPDEETPVVIPEQTDEQKPNKEPEKESEDETPVNVDVVPKTDEPSVVYHPIVEKTPPISKEVEPERTFDELPKTGETPVNPYVQGAGILSMLMGFFFLLKRKKNKKGEK